MVSDPTKVSRGVAHSATLVAVKDRRYTEPIPDEFLPRFEAAGLVVDDSDRNVIFYRADHKAGVVWACEMPGCWLAWRAHIPGAIRVRSRDDGLRYVLGDVVAEVAS